MFKKESFANEIAENMLRNELSATYSPIQIEQSKISTERNLELKTKLQAAIKILANIALKAMVKESALPARKEELSFVERIQSKIDLLKAAVIPEYEKQLKVIDRYFNHIIELGTDLSELAIIDEALDKIFDDVYGEIEVSDSSYVSDGGKKKKKKKSRTKEEKEVFKHYGFGDLNSCSKK